MLCLQGGIVVMRQTAKQLNRKRFLEIGIIGLKLNRGFSQLPFLRSIIAVKTTWPFHGRNNLFNLQLFVTKKVLIYLLANSSRETVGVQVIMVINHCPISPCLFHSSSYLMANNESAIFSMNISCH